MKNPINYSFKTEIWPFLIIIITVAVGFWAYPNLPERVISHWNIYGQADDWMSRDFHVWFFPALIIGIYLLLSVVPKFDPKGERYKDFANVYLAIRTLMLLVLAVVFVAATLFNLGYNINIGATVAGAVGLTMIILGNYFGKLKRNWFVGIRTPWSLSSENVWNKTHRLGGRLFILWGLGIMITPWLMPNAVLAIMLGGLVMVAWIMIYSYRLYKKEKQDAK